MQMQSENLQLPGKYDLFTRILAVLVCILAALNWEVSVQNVADQPSNAHRLKIYNLWLCFFLSGGVHHLSGQLSIHADYHKSTDGLREFAVKHNRWQESEDQLDFARAFSMSSSCGEKSDTADDSVTSVKPGKCQR